MKDLLEFAANLNTVPKVAVSVVVALVAIVILYVLWNPAEGVQEPGRVPRIDGQVSPDSDTPDVDTRNGSATSRALLGLEETVSESAGDAKEIASEEVRIVLRQAVGEQVGIIYPTPDAWYWLLSNLTVVNQSDESDSISFELNVPTRTGSTIVLRPINVEPDDIILPRGTRLFGVENMEPRTTETGALLFRLDRRTFPRVRDHETGEVIAMDTPDMVGSSTTGSSITIRSELFPQRRPKTFLRFLLTMPEIE